MASNQPKRGDLLKFDRGPYSHFGVAVNEKEMVHVAPETGDTKSLKQPTTVRKQNIDDVKGESNLTAFFPKNAKYSAEETAKRAEAEIGKPFKYNLAFNNCEHFATDKATKEGHSKQADRVMMNAAIAMSGNDDSFTQSDVNHFINYVYDFKKK